MSEPTDRQMRAYLDQDFMHSPDARALRILAEYIEPLSRFKHYEIEDTIIFFGSARILPRDRAEKELARKRCWPETAP